MSWRNRFLGSAAALGLTLVSSAAALAQSAPTALVIGNSNYENFADLRDSSANADTVATQLTNNGYNVTLVQDGSANAIRAALSDFLATGDGPDHRLFFYGGHTVNVDGEDYIVPVDAAVNSGLDLDFGFVPMSAVTAQMNRDNTPDIVVMDTGYRHFADNELANVLPNASVTDQPATPSNDGDTLTVLAVEPNTNNISQANRRNVFADIFGNRLSRADQNPVSFFTSLANRVANRSSNRQRPYVSNGFNADVVMNETVVIAPPTPVGPTAREERLWNLIVGSNDATDYEDYLTFFPEGFYSDDARQAIAALTQPQQPATPQYTVDPINQPYYVVRLSNVRSGPSTEFARVASLPEGTLVTNIGKVRGTRWFQIVMPDNSLGFIFETLVTPYSGSELQGWAIAENTGTIQAYQQYLSDFPTGPNADQARVSIEVLKEQAYQDALAAYNIQGINQEVVLVRRSNVRNLPSTRGAVLATLEGGTRLTATGDVLGQTWTRLDLNGQAAFVYDSLFVPYAGSVYEAWDRAQEADTVLGYRRFRNQYPNSQFENDAQTAISALQSAQNANFTPIARQYVISRASNVFEEPSRQSTLLTQVAVGDKFRALRQTADGNWVELRLGRGQVGYVRSGRVEEFAGSVFQGWEDAQGQDTLAAYRLFRDTFPGSRFDDDAVERIDALIANQSVMAPINETVIAVRRAFVYAQADLNAPRLGILAEGALVPAVAKGGNPAFFKIQTNSGEGFLLASDAVAYVGSEREAWDQARRANSVAALNAYLAAYPNGRYVQQAAALRQQLAPQDQNYQFSIGGLNFNLRLDEQ